MYEMQSEYGKNKLVDRYNRQLDYLRVSITDRCNFRCVYCMGREPFKMFNHCDILRYEEILRIIRTGIDLGIRKVRITGGEPLIRRDLDLFLGELASLSGLTDISLTTNGLLLDEMAEMLKNKGIKRLNISLDSLVPDKFRSITGVDGFKRVWNGILKAFDLGFSPIKINVVAMRGVNEGEVEDFSALTRKLPFHVRFIEYMPIGNPGMTAVGKPLLIPEIKALAEKTGPLFPVSPSLSGGPARRFRYKDAPGEVGFIGAVSEHFCGACNRLRLTAAGLLRPCLLSDSGVDVAGLIRSGCSDRELAELFVKAAFMKNERHRIGMSDEPGDSVLTEMSSIGG